MQVVPKIAGEGAVKAPPGRTVADTAAGAASEVQGAAHVCRVRVAGWRCAAAVGRSQVSVLGWQVFLKDPIGGRIWDGLCVTVHQGRCDGGATCCPK